MHKVIIGYLIALLFWFLMFSEWTAGNFNFWYTMLTATGVLTLCSLIFGKKYLKELYQFQFKWLLIGVVSALLLYLIFYTGNIITRLIFDFAQNQIENVYSTKEQANKLFIALSLLLWIGPAEEVFWRGYAQHQLSLKFGPTKALIINSLVYAFVHIWAFNFMLFLAALICGFFWGWMFMRYKNVLPALFSHAIWDVMIFILIPLQ